MGVFKYDPKEKMPQMVIPLMANGDDSKRLKSQ